MPKAFDPTKQSDAAQKAIKDGEARIEKLNETKKKIADRLAAVQEKIDAENKSIQDALKYLKAVDDVSAPEQTLAEATAFNGDGSEDAI